MLKKLRNLFKQTSKGQSLVELALIFPILVFMMMGVFEVGWALRSYLVLVNLDRELARFAVRPGYLDYSEKNVDSVGYNQVLSHTQTISGEIDADFETNSTLIITHFVVDTGLPCPRNSLGSCDCETDEFTYDDIIISPDTPGFSYYTQEFPTTPIGGASTNLNAGTRLVYADEIAKLTRNNNKLNCEFVKKQEYTDLDVSLETSTNNLIVVEVAYDQPQLFGFPLVSNPFTDPVPLYAKTTMRLVAGARSAGGELNFVGPLCKAYPWYTSSVTYGTSQNVFSGWVQWGTKKYGETTDQHLRYQLAYPQMALNNFDPPYGIKTGLSVGTLTPSSSLLTQLDIDMNDPQTGIIGQQVIIPVRSGGTIQDFALIQIESVDLALGQIIATPIRSVADGTFCE